MSEFTPLREAVDTVASRSPSPDFGDLKRRATRRGRRRVVMVAAAAAAVIVVGGGLAAGTIGSDQRSLIGEPTTPAPTTGQESDEASPTSSYTLGLQLDAILVQVPGWAIATKPDYADFDYAFNGPCTGNWTKGSTWGSDGGIGQSSRAGFGGVGFQSAAQASDAAARFVENLESCTTTGWRTQPIAPIAGAVLAYSDDGVAWIQQKGAAVRVLQVPTTDGPPPLAVQAEVAEWMVAYMTRHWQSRSTEP